MDVPGVSLPPTPADAQQPLLPLDFVPASMRGHGLREAHSAPLVGLRTTGGDWRTRRTTPADAWRETDPYQAVEWPRTGTSFAALVLDCDSREAVERAHACAVGAGPLPTPNLAVDSGQEIASWGILAGRIRADRLETARTGRHEADRARLSPSPIGDVREALRTRAGGARAATGRAIRVGSPGSAALPINHDPRKHWAYRVYRRPVIGPKGAPATATAYLGTGVARGCLMIAASRLRLAIR